MQQESTSLCDTKYKIVFLGDMGVGKTSIIQRFVKDQFDAFNNVLSILTKPTVGIDFLTRNISFQSIALTIQIKLIGSNYGIQLAKKSTKAQYLHILEMLIAPFLYFSLEDHKPLRIFVIGFNYIETMSLKSQWLSFQVNLGNISGNKYDLIDNSNSSPSKNNKTLVRDLQINASQLARKQNMIFKSVSAKTGKQINMSFKNIIQEIQRKNNKQQSSQLLDEQQKLQKQFLNKFQKLRLNSPSSSQLNCCYI